MLNKTRLNRSIRRIVALASTLCALLICANVSAQSIAVLGVGGTDAAMADELGEILLDAVSNNPDFQAIDRRDLALDEAMMLLGCSELSPECMADLALTLEVDRVLYGAISDQDANTLVLRYYDANREDDLLEQDFDISNTNDRTELELRLAAVISGRTVLRVLSDVPGVRVSLDGEMLGETPVVAFDISEGTHNLEATCDGCDVDSRTINVLPGRFYTETVSPESTTVANNNNNNNTTASGDGSMVGIITTAVGGTLLVTGAVFGLLTSGTQGDFDDTNSREEAEALADTGETQALLTNIFLATGAAVTATGIILILTSGPAEAAPEQGPVSAAPWFMPEGGGVVVDWNF